MTEDEGSGESDVARRLGGFLGDAFEEQFGGRPADRLDVAVDQRQRPRVGGGEVGAVASDQRQVAADIETLLLDRTEHTDEDLISPGNDRRRRVGGAQQRARFALAVAGGEVARADQVLG